MILKNSFMGASYLVLSSSQICHLFLEASKNLQILVSSLRATMVKVPKPSFLTSISSNLSQKSRASLKNTLWWLTIHSHVYTYEDIIGPGCVVSGCSSRGIWSWSLFSSWMVSEVFGIFRTEFFYCLMLTQGGLSLRWDSLKDKNTWVWFWAHFTKGSRLAVGISNTSIKALILAIRPAMAVLRLFDRSVLSLSLRMSSMGVQYPLSKKVWMHPLNSCQSCCI